MPLESIPWPLRQSPFTLLPATGLPLVPAQAQWLHAFSVPMLMSPARARKELGWRPRHTAADTLAAAVAAARERRIL
jgi:nucleoside-diphosphate-sugar epimerase